MDDIEKLVRQLELEAKDKEWEANKLEYGKRWTATRPSDTYKFWVNFWSLTPLYIMVITFVILKYWKQLFSWF